MMGSIETFMAFYVAAIVFCTVTPYVYTIYTVCAPSCRCPLVYTRLYNLCSSVWTRHWSRQPPPPPKELPLIENAAYVEL